MTPAGPGRVRFGEAMATTLDVLDRPDVEATEPATIAEAVPAVEPYAPEVVWSAAVDADLSGGNHGRLTVLMPSRGRPGSLARIGQAWRDTGAIEQGARLVLLLDSDDPAIGDYALPSTGLTASDGWWDVWINDSAHPGPGLSNMGGKVNEAARDYAAAGTPFLAFQNDDHVPESDGWVAAYLAALVALRDRLGVGVVYGDDGLRGAMLCTEFAVTESWVTTLGRLFPALAGHQYTDTSVRDLARAADCLLYLPEVKITHKHPTAPGGDAWDETSRSANSVMQREADRMTFGRWSDRPATARAAGLASQAARLRALRP